MSTTKPCTQREEVQKARKYVGPVSLPTTLPLCGYVDLVKVVVVFLCKECQRGLGIP
jgi:hypothetical protein